MPAAHVDKPRARKKKIEKLISKIETLTKLLSLNGTREPPQEEDNKEKPEPKQIFKLCSQLQKNPVYLWDLENNAKTRPTGWMTKQKKYYETGSWVVVKRRR